MKTKEEKIKMIEELIERHETEKMKIEIEDAYTRGLQQGYIEALEKIIEYIKSGLL